MQSGEISDGQLSASSERDSNHSAAQGRLYFVHPNKAESWAAASNDTDQWLQADLVVLHTKVIRVATQGSNGHQREWVRKYNLQQRDPTSTDARHHNNRNRNHSPNHSKNHSLLPHRLLILQVLTKEIK